MNWLLAGSLLGLLGLSVSFGIFDGQTGHSTDDDDGSGPGQDVPHGTAGNDILSATEGAIEGWGGDDDITLSGVAVGYGNSGNDDIELRNEATGYGGKGDDRILIADDFGGANEAHGGAGNDTMTGLITTDDALFGGAGDDILRGGNTYGGDGDDDLTGLINVHGEEGDDTLTGFSQVFGGGGDDLINLRNSGGETNAVGSASGGEGNDTILAADSRDGAGQISGDGGDDLILFTDHSSVSGGAGDDVLIARGAFVNEPEDSGLIYLGEGNDLLAFNPIADVVPIEGPPDNHLPDIVHDFDPVADQLAIIYPQAHQGQLDVTISPDPDGAFTDVTITIPTPYLGPAYPAGTALQAFRLEGVANLSRADILLFSDTDAVLANTPYGTLGPVA